MLLLSSVLELWDLREWGHSCDSRSTHEMMNVAFRRMVAPATASFRRAFSSQKSAQKSGGGPVAWYMGVLESHPLTTKCVTSGVLAFASDAACQKIDKAYISKGKKPYDYERTARFTFLGTVYMAPILHVWYGFLMSSFIGTGALVTAQRVFFDQCCFAPVYLAGLFSANMVLEGEGDKIVAKLKADLFDTITANFSVWVPVMIVAFKFVPANLQVQYSNVIGFFWNIYLSFKLAEEVAPETVEGGEKEG